MLTGCISNESYKNVLASHSCKLYTPNYFIRIALALLTIVAVLFAGLLFGLIFMSSGADKAITVLTIFFAASCYAALELFIKQKSYYNAGIDNVLITIVLVLIQTALLLQTQDIAILSFVTFLISAWLCLRFIDAFMAMIAYVALFVFVFLIYKARWFCKSNSSFCYDAIFFSLFI